MDDKKSLSLKKDLYNMGTQHNKLTTLVLVLLGEVEKLKKDLGIIKNNINNNETFSQNEINYSNEENIKDIDEKAEQILKQLNINNISKNI